MNKYGKRNLTAGIVFILIGIALIVCDKMDVWDNEMLLGMGGAWIFIGILDFIKCFKYTRNAAYKDKIDASFTDERYKYISMKAWSWTGYLAMIILGTAAIALIIAENADAAAICGGIMCGLLLLYWISFMIIQKKN